MIEIPDLVAGGLAAGTLSALALGGGLLHARRQLSRQRAESDALRRQLDEATRAFTSEIEHLASRRLPAAARALAHPHVVVPGPLAPETTGTPLGRALDGVLQGLRVELAAQHVRVDAAAQAGMRGATREIQAALYRLQDALRGLQQQYDDPELAHTLFQLDHENEQSLRRAQVAAVVCGAWVGLAREESHLVDAVTGGQARLAGYRRVAVHHHLRPGTALVSHAVEPVAIITAELLDNALRHSSPDTEVLVSLEHVHHGVCVTVDDAGVGMTSDERERAQRLVAGREPILLTDLGDPPRMGLAAIGQLTRQFDLSVDVSTISPYGGVRAVLLVAEHLLSRIDPTERPPAASAPRSTRETVSERYAVDTAPPTGPADGRTPQTPVGDPPDAPAHTYGAEPPGNGAPRVPAHAAPGTGVRGVPEHDSAYDSAPDDALDTGGLPRRRRRTPAATGQEPAPRPAAPQAAAPHRAEQAAAALGALQSATAAARAAGGAAHTPNDSDHTDHEGGAAR
ncbi:ATP-binding protein [Streptomyces actuosus]|uniref:histidine kinase n=1 Tax=Streptomyces actuosus TaxID=1885 RepID=A0ABS2VUJ2_STRAS|nr:ATP-binding protein [Streptomyces actuosus]MBN0046715.1 ATP-binding protein [Streptomyces actuosus]